MENKWKTIAIIFIIITILETSILYWAWDTGTDIIENENECMYNICSEAETYIYYEYEQVCECYIDNEIIKSKYIK